MDLKALVFEQVPWQQGSSFATGFGFSSLRSFLPFASLCASHHAEGSRIDYEIAAVAAS
jgi:hypothetical protein